MSQPPEDPHSAETQIGRPPPPPPPLPPPPMPPPSPGWPQPAWQQPTWHQPTWQPGPPQGPPPGPPPGWGGPPGGYGGPPRKRSKLPWVVAAVVLVLLLAGGGVTAFLLAGDDDGDDPPGAAPTTEAEPATGSTPADPGGEAYAVSGLWSGTYDCAQGITSLDITIAPSGADGSLSAVFTFSPSAENPGVPEGSFLMEGSIADGGLTLTGTDWVERPPGYVLIDLSAQVTDPSADAISGEVTNAGCTSFEISR